MAQWPNLNAAALVYSHSRTAPWRSTHTYPPHAPVANHKNAPPHITWLAHIALSLAGKPMAVPDISAHARRIAAHLGFGEPFTDAGAYQAIKRSPDFQWVGNRTYALLEWQTVATRFNTTPTKSRQRSRIADEILSILKDTAKPISYGKVQQHITERFNVNPTPCIPRLNVAPT